MLKRVPVGKEPEGVTVSPDGKTVFVTSEEQSAVAAVDIETMSLTKTMPTGPRPRSIAVTPDGRTAFVTDELGAMVTVLDLTEAFCRAGAFLTAQVGLSDRVTFQQGNAMDLPFADGVFDLVWIQHASMNIADKERLYTELGRVLRPGGGLALYQVMAERWHHHISRYRGRRSQRCAFCCLQRRCVRCWQIWDCAKERGWM